jgi:uncharacterized membrane protein
MWTKLSSLLDTIRGSLWFIPSLMAAAAVILAFISLWADRHVLGEEPTGRFAWVFDGGEDGAREVLSTVASSMITVAGVIFSVTVVALTLASQQFGPRLLRNFMRDTGTQIVLGTFISIHLYCLIVLRSVRAPDAGGFVPHLSVTIAILLAVSAAGLLIYFFHHATSSLRASTLIAEVATDLERAIDELLPERVEQRGQPPEATPSMLPIPAADLPRRSRPISSLESGYLQAVDAQCLIGLAKKRDLILRLDRRPGDFVTRDAVLAQAFPGERATDDLIRKVNEACILGEERTVVQDVSFPAHQLTEIAVRALSPGTNDPSTALACIDRLGAAFIRLATRRMPSPYRYDESGALRLIAFPVSLSELLDDTFGQIQQYGRTSSAVTVRLLDTIMNIAPHVQTDEGRTALARQAEKILKGSDQALPREGDRESVRARYDEARAAILRGMAA